MSDSREAMRAVVEALEIGRDAAAEVAAKFHETMWGYRPEEHKRVDADVAQIDAALSLLRAALEAREEPAGVPAAPAPSADERMRHDYPILQQFHSKHALGAMAAPSCLCCGRQTHPITRPIAVQHMELPAIVICKQCKDATTGAASPAAATQGDAWQPIETAPKVKDAPLLLTNGESVSQGWWMDEPGYIRENRDLEGRYIDQDESDGFTGWMDCDGGMQPEPTHWMPMPPPPAAIGAESEQATEDGRHG